MSRGGNVRLQLSPRGWSGSGPKRLGQRIWGRRADVLLPNWNNRSCHHHALGLRHELRENTGFSFFLKNIADPCNMSEAGHDSGSVSQWTSCISLHGDGDTVAARAHSEKFCPCVYADSLARCRRRTSDARGAKYQKAPQLLNKTLLRLRDKTPHRIQPKQNQILIPAPMRQKEKPCRRRFKICCTM